MRKLYSFYYSRWIFWVREENSDDRDHIGILVLQILDDVEIHF
jgi:hypothetical protein